MGDTVWTFSAIKGFVTSFEAPDIEWIIEETKYFGKEIFLTRDEAEAALKENAR
uniref:Uncharacterized protein n=1 Tax=Dulem virus 33 TaxID=3145751 RepID=A0AAU8B5J1_9CAUD